MWMCVRACEISGQTHHVTYTDIGDHILILLIRSFPYLGVGASRFHSPLSPVLCFFYLYMFLLYVFSYNITPPQFRSSYISVSIHFNILITTSSPVFLSTWSNRLSASSLLCSPHLPLLLFLHSLMFSIHIIRISHLSFWHVLLSLSQCPDLTSILQNRSDDGLI